MIGLMRVLVRGTTYIAIVWGLLSFDAYATSPNATHVVSLGSTASPSAQKIHFQCEVSVEKLNKALEGIENELRKIIEPLSAEMVKKKIERDDPDLQWAILIWPESLALKFEYYRQYDACARAHSRLRDALLGKAEPRLDIKVLTKGEKERQVELLMGWEACIKTSYRENLPPAAKHLLDCYKQILGPGAVKAYYNHCSNC